MTASMFPLRRLLGLGAALTAGALAAQEPPPSPGAAAGVVVSDAGNRVIYTPAYFTPYNVVTARDQLERIPGLQDVFEGGNDDQRGFGNTGDQVLINGKRLSGKSNDIGSAMDRIQARQVVRIEVIRGTVSGLDVRSQGRVVNVVLDGTLVTGVGSWQAWAEDYSDSSFGGGGELSYSGDIGAFNYLVSASGGSRRDLEDRIDAFYAPAGALTERQLEASRERSDDHALTANTSYTFDTGDVLNFNARYASEDERATEDSDRYLPRATGELFDNELYILGRDIGTEWELGGDYAHTRPNGNVFNALFVWTATTGDEDTRFAVSRSGRGHAVREVQLENGDSSELIARGTYQWGITDTRSILSGAEFARNEVTTRVDLLEEAGGTLVPVPLFNQDSTVEETRFEAFTTYTWQPRASLLVEGSLDLEFSELGQEGSDISRAREFFFARPRLVVRHDLSELTQLRARFERRVDQLDFEDFVASFSNDDNRINVISAGNPELVPEQAWEYELTWERRFADDLGLVAVTGLYGDIRDIIGSVPLLVRDADGVERMRTATGNIDSGRTLELKVDGSFRLAALGLRTLLVEGSYTRRDTQLRDPFTGEQRVFNGVFPYEWQLGFRHDTSWHNLSYGLTALQNGPSRVYDIDISDRAERDPDLELFVEVRPLPNLTVGLSVEQGLRADFGRERLQYAGQRRDGNLQRRELRVARPGREITLTVQGVF